MSEQSLHIGEALKCANEQGKYFALLDNLYSKTSDSLTMIVGDAAKLGMETKRFAECL